MSVFEKRTPLPASAAAVFAWHAAKGAFARLTPPFDKARVVRDLPRLADGEYAVIEVGIGPAKVQWTARHTEVKDGRDGGVAGFVDTMEHGPFSSWRHEHIFEPVDEDNSILHDRITWESLPGAGLIVPARLERMFAFRHAVTLDDLLLRRDLKAPTPLVVGITGATGLIGTELTALLQVLGHEVRAFQRVKNSERATPGQIAWNPDNGDVDATAAAGLDAVVHLAGENIAAGRLTDAKKERLREQRINQTKKLFTSLAALKTPPKVVVGASAVGFYGDRGDEVLDEASAAGTDYLAGFCVDWQDAVLHTPSQPPWRVVTTRIGIVQSPSGGALGTILPLFQAGLGGKLADGKSWTPAIGIDDMAGVILRAIFDDRLAGVVNAVGPEPIRNVDYTKVLGHVVNRPAILPVPRFALKLVLGEFADNVLASNRAYPRKLTAIGHRFRHLDVEHALRHLLGHVA